jgi:NADPH:quinone reductase-like Zn-dependent oxidoreductase/acyl carrier protein
VRLVPDGEPTAASIAALVAHDDVTDVVVVRGLDTAALGGADPVGDQRPALAASLAVAQAVAASSTPVRTWFVTRGALAADGTALAPEQAPTAGFVATLAAELPDRHWCHVDLDPRRGPDACASDLVAALDRRDGATAVAVRDGVHLVATLAPCRAGPVPAPEGSRLATSSPGLLDALHVAPAPRRAPGPGEVEIEVAYSGLNFRDVLIALDEYPERVETFGNECSGTVVRVGDGVTALQLGDRVVAMGVGAFASHLTTLADLAVRIPDELGAADAATIPIAFATAEHALVDLGRLAAGDRVLIHAAAGGVGLAAVQVAMRAGAEVFATAGSPRKRAVLEAMGVRHVFDSRTLAFADDVLSATDGRGVDVVLNSLMGDAIARSLDALAPAGRFLEIGRLAPWTPERVAEVRPDVEYRVVFLGDLTDGDPPAMQRLLARLVARFADGALTPLPRRAFDVADVVDAFRTMAQARHIGKIVVRQSSTAAARAIRPDGTYVVTGGSGGVGRLLARRLVERGARHVALVARGAPDAAAIDELRALGASVAAAQADVGSRADVDRVFAELGATMPPVCGVVHAAGANDDAARGEQTWERFAAVLGPKLAGTWHLHAATRHLPLHLFVAIGSAASVLGGPGQANYAAANAFLDAFGAWRRDATGTGTTLSWGPWDRVGMTAALADVDRERMTRRGIEVLPVEQALALFDRLTGADAPPGAHVVAMRRARNDGARTEDGDATTGPPAPRLLEQWATTVPGLRRPAVAAFVTGAARRVLGLAASTEIDPRQPFQELGLDSLMAVELRNAVGAALGRPQPATLLFDHPTTAALVDHLLALVPAAAPPPAAWPAPDAAAVVAAPASPAANPTDHDDLAALSEDEAEALLLRELERGAP